MVQPILRPNHSLLSLSKSFGRLSPTQIIEPPPLPRDTPPAESEKQEPAEWLNVVLQKAFSVMHKEFSAYLYASLKDVGTLFF